MAFYLFLLFDFLFPPDLIHIFADNRMDTAKSRTSEDILRSSRLSAYSPEPYTQSESDYYPYTSSPKGRKKCHFRDFRIATCKISCIFFLLLLLFSTGTNTDTEVQFLFCDCVVTIICSATLLLCSTLGSTFIQGHRFYLFFSLSLSDAEKTLLDRRGWRELESRSSKSKGFIIFSFCLT